MQVHDAVTGAVTEVGRRLSERLATKQDLQALSFKVGSEGKRGRHPALTGAA